MDKSRQTIKNKYFKVCLPTWKVHAYDAFWKSFYEDDIHPKIQVAFRVFNSLPVLLSECTA